MGRKRYTEMDQSNVTILYVPYDVKEDDSMLQFLDETPGCIYALLHGIRSHVIYIDPKTVDDINELVVYVSLAYGARTA